MGTLLTWLATKLFHKLSYYTRFLHTRQQNMAGVALMTHYCPHCDRALVEDYKHGKICYQCTDCSYYIYKQDITDNIIYQTKGILKLKTAYINPKHEWLDTLMHQPHFCGPIYNDWSYAIITFTRSLQRGKNCFNQLIDSETQQRWLKLITDRQQESWSYYLWPPTQRRFIIVTFATATP